eukprot:scaffold33925_cov104-Isochrysis_galbana.AAC.1
MRGAAVSAIHKHMATRRIYTSIRAPTLLLTNPPTIDASPNARPTPTLSLASPPGVRAPASTYGPLETARMRPLHTDLAPPSGCVPRASDMPPQSRYGPPVSDWARDPCAHCP